MNTQLKVKRIRPKYVSTLAEGLQKLEIPVDVRYLKNNRAQEGWNINCNGLKFDKDGATLFSCHKESAVLSLCKFPIEKRQGVLDLFLDSGIVERPNFSLAVILAFLFLPISIFIINYGFVFIGSTLGAAMVFCLVSGLLELLLIGTTSHQLDGNRFVTFGYIFWGVGVLAFAPSSILTFPLVRSLLQVKALTSRTQFDIYTKHLEMTEAVKKGWSWPAFFFGISWVFYCKMWKLGFGVLAVNFLLGLIQSNVLSSIGILVTLLVLGKNGNKWRVLNLNSRGYSYKGTFTASRGEAAIARHLEANAQNQNGNH